MTNLFQPLDLTENGSAKVYMKRTLTEWYSNFVLRQPDEGKVVDGIGVELKLSISEPLHTGSIKNLWDYLTSKEGDKIIFNGWKAAFITKAIEKGSKPLSPLNPFYEVDLLTKKGNEMFEVIPVSIN